MKHLKRYQTGGPIQEPTGGECPQSTTNPQMNATNESVAIQDADIAYNPSGGETGNPCAGCAVFDVSTRIQGCMQEGGETKGYCWINQFECESAGTCNKFEAGGPIVDDEISYDMQGRYNNEPPPPQQQEQQMAPPGIEAPQMGPQMGAPAYAFGGEVLKHGGEPCHGWGKVRGRKYLPRAEYGRFTTPNVDYGRNNLAPDYSTAPWLNTNPYLAGFGQMAKSLYRGGKNLKNIWGKQKPITANYPMSQLTQEAKADYDSKPDVLNNYVNYGAVASSGTCFASNGSPTTCPPGVAAGTTLNSAGTATDMTPEIQTNLQGFGRRYGGSLPKAQTGFSDWWRERMDNLKDPNLTISGYQKPDRIRQSKISQDEYDTMIPSEDNSPQEGEAWFDFATRTGGNPLMPNDPKRNEIFNGTDWVAPQATQTMYDANIEPRELSPAYDTEYIPGSEDWNQEPGQNRELTPDDPEWDGLFGNSRKKQNNKGKVWDTVGTVAETAVGLAKGANIIGDELEASRQRTHNFNQRMGDYAFEEKPGSQPYQPLGPDTNTGIYGPNRKVISHWGKYGTELPKAQTIGEFQNRIPLPSKDINKGSIKPMNSLVDKLGLTKPGFFGYGNPFWFGEHGMMGGKPLPSDWEGYNVPKLNIETQEWENQPYHTTFLQELQRTGVEPTGTLTSAGGPGVGFREYFPYSDPIGLGLETDVDPTGPGAGILLNNYRLRQFGNYLADKIGDNSVGNWFQDWQLPPGFTYAGVEMAGNLPMPFGGITVSMHDVDKLQKWAEHPDNQTILDIADYSKHGIGPGLYAWNKGPTIGGRFQLTNPFNPMAKPLLQSPDFFGGRRIHNPISGTGEGIGGRMGIRGGNIVPSIDLGPKSKYINPVNLFTKTKGPLELGFRGGFANIKEEVIAEAQELRKTGKLVDEGKDVIKYSKANKLLSQGDAMKKVYNAKTGAVPTGKLLTKTGVPSALDKMGEALYGTKGPGAYQKSGNTLANMMRNSKIPYGKIINNPWLWKNLARGMMIPDALNFASGLTHRPGQPVREWWSPGTNFGLDDSEMQKSSEYGMFPTIQNWLDHRDPVHPLVSTDQTEEDRFKAQENKIYKEEFKKKHGSRPTPPTPVEDKPVFKAAEKQVWYDKDGKIHKVPEGSKIEYPSGLHNYQEPEMNWLQSMLPSHLQPQTIHERAPYAWDASYKDPKTGKYVDLWSYDMPLRKSAEKKAPEAEQKRVEKEKEAWWDWYNSGEQKLKRAMHHSQNISGSPKFKEGGVVNVDEDLLSELIAAGADIEIM